MEHGFISVSRPSISLQQSFQINPIYIDVVDGSLSFCTAEGLSQPEKQYSFKRQQGPENVE